MTFKKHFKVLLPLLILVAQAVSGVFGFILFGWLSTALGRIGGENSGLEEFFAYVSAFIVLTMTTSVTPFINLELEKAVTYKKSGIQQKYWSYRASARLSLCGSTAKCISDRWMPVGSAMRWSH